MNPILQHFIPQTLENRAAIRTALATFTAILIAFALHMDRPYWSGMTVVILANIYTGNIIDKAIMRITGTIIGAGVGYFLAGFIVNSFFLYLVSCFLLVTISVYYYNLSRYAYAYLLFALTAFIVIAELAFTPTDAFFVAIWRPAEIALGVIISAMFALFVFPNPIQKTVNKTLTHIFLNLIDLLKLIEKLMITEDKALLIEIDHKNLAWKKDLHKAIDMLDFMRREIGFERHKLEEFRSLLATFISIGRLINYNLGNQFFIHQVSYHQIFPIQEIFAHFYQQLENIAAYSLQSLPQQQLTSNEGINKLNTALKTILLDPAVQDNCYLGVTHFLRQLSHQISNLHKVKSRNVLEKNKFISYQEQLRNDPDVIIHAIKAGLAATLALIFWLMSNWPGGLNGIISSIVISIRRSIYEMKNISIYRLLGCLLGGGLALCSLDIFAFGLYDLTILILFGVWGFALFSFKYPNQAYIGLQANIALVITMAQAGGPPTTLSAPLERLGGIVIGIVASFIVANGIWRTNLWELLLRQIQKLLKQLRHNCCSILHTGSQMQREKIFDLNNLILLIRGLIENLHQLRLAPGKKALLESYQIIFDQLILMQATLMHIKETIDIPQATAYAASLHIDLHNLTQAVVDLYQKEKISSTKKLQNELMKTADAIVFYQVNNTVRLEDLENCEAYIHSLLQLVAAITIVWKSKKK